MLNDAQLDLLDKSGIKPLLIDDDSVIQKFSEDPMEVSEAQLLEIHNKYSNFIKGCRQVLTGLPSVLDAKYLEEFNVPDDKAVLRLRFTNQAEIKNVVNLNDWSKTWHTIARGFTMAVKKSPEDFEIINTDKGSVIIDLLLHLDTIQLVSDTVSSLADMTTSLIEMKAAWEGYKFIQSKFNEGTDHNESEYATKIAKEEKEIYEKVVEKLYNEGKIQNEDCKNELTAAVRELSKFNQKGGEMSCLPSSTDKTECKELNQNFYALSEKKIPELIEHKENKDVNDL